MATKQYVIETVTGRYVNCFDVEQRLIVECSSVEQAKKFRSTTAANAFRRLYENAGYGLELGATVLPVEVK